MELDLYQIDAFASEPFRGNPAAVCPLTEWIDDGLMQKIALENNLSETAFFVEEGETAALRWFTPSAEIELCGHATLAAGYLLLDHLGRRQREARFTTLSGDLVVRRDSGRLLLDLPAWPAAATEAPESLIHGMGMGMGMGMGTGTGITSTPVEIRAARKNYLVVYGTEAEVRALAPNMSALAKLHPHGVIATAPGTDFDFVSRYFAPSWGVPEDPATGSAHCTLAPYWAERLGKTELRAFQASPRGAEIDCFLRGDGVTLGGNCTLYLEGKIRV